MKYIVYQHYCRESGKSYIGYTEMTLEQRSGKMGKRYLYKKKNGEYYHEKFAHAIHKYGWDGFDHNILKELETEKEALDWEVKLIEEYDSFNNGYNGTKGGDHLVLSEEARKKMSEAHKRLKGKLSPNYGIKRTEEQIDAMRRRQTGVKRGPHSDETKKKISKRFKGIPCSEETRKKLSESCKSKIPVYQYDMDGNFIKRYDSAREAARELKFSSFEKILLVCRGIKISYYGYLWSFKYEENIKAREKKENKGRSKPVYKIDKETGEILEEFPNMQVAADKYGFSREAINNCCLGKTKSSYGFIWRHK